MMLYHNKSQSILYMYIELMTWLLFEMFIGRSGMYILLWPNINASCSKLFFEETRICICILNLADLVVNYGISNTIVLEIP